MKKIFAVITSLAAACSMLTACGLIGESSSDISSSSESGKASQSESYEDDLRAFFTAMSEMNVEDVVRYMYPERVWELLVKMDMADQFVDSLDIESHDVEITNISELEVLDQEQLDGIGLTYSALDLYCDLAEEYGIGPDNTIDNLSEEQQEEIREKLQAEPEQSNYNISKGYDVSVEFLSDGKEEQEYFYAVYVEEEGWKFERSMRKYVEKSKQASINANTKTLHHAIASVLVDFDEEGIDINGTYIISSIPAKNVNVPEGIDMYEFYKQVNEYFAGADKFYYFCAVNNGDIVFVAAETQDNDYTGVYPVGYIPDEMDGGVLTTREASEDEEKLTLEELYDITVDIIK